MTYEYFSKNSGTAGKFFWMICCTEAYADPSVDRSPSAAVIAEATSSLYHGMQLLQPPPLMKNTRSVACWLG